ncbi:hypothetical protein Dimus_030712 [Dionaea muscipula]
MQAGIASTSTHLANGDGARQTEINFSSLKCFIPSSGSHHSEETSGFTNKIFSFNSEENASTVPAYNDIEACDEAVSFEENITDEASMSSAGGSNVDTMDSQIINPEKGKRSFHYLGACIESKENRDAARSEEKASRDLVRAKRQEIDRAQTLMNRTKNAMTFEDATSRIDEVMLGKQIINMEHQIEHETLPLNEEKQLIREIKQLKQMSKGVGRCRTLLLSLNDCTCWVARSPWPRPSDVYVLHERWSDEDVLWACGSSHYLGVGNCVKLQAVRNNALWFLAAVEARAVVEVLRKEMDTLRERLSRAEEAARAAKKKFDDETALLNDSNSKLSAA